MDHLDKLALNGQVRELPWTAISNSYIIDYCCTITYGFNDELAAYYSRIMRFLVVGDRLKMHNGQTPMTLADKKEHPTVGPWCLLWWKVHPTKKQRHMDFISPNWTLRKKKTELQPHKLRFNQQTRGLKQQHMGFCSFLSWNDFSEGFTILPIF